MATVFFILAILAIVIFYGCVWTNDIVTWRRARRARPVEATVTNDAPGIRTEPAADLHRWDALNAVMAVPADAPEWLKPQQDGSYGTPPFEPVPAPPDPHKGEKALMAALATPAPTLARPALNQHHHDALLRSIELQQRLTAINVEADRQREEWDEIREEITRLHGRPRDSRGRFVSKREQVEYTVKPDEFHVGDHVRDQHGNTGVIRRIGHNGVVAIKPDEGGPGVWYRRADSLVLTTGKAPASEKWTDLRDVADQINENALKLAALSGKPYQECLTVTTADFNHRESQAAIDYVGGTPRVTTPPVETSNWQITDHDIEIAHAPDPLPSSLFHVGDHVITSAQQAGVITKINRGAEEAEVRYVGSKMRMWWAITSLRHDDIPF